MLQALRVKNFQVHEQREIQLDPRITTIAGPTDAGKSSLCRALRWLCLNQPDGASFIQQGETEATVRVLLDDKTVVTRRRGKSANLYLIGKTEYKTPGRGTVPDPVADVLRLSELNFQDQHDAPFWLSLSPAEVSRQLNAVVDLGVIDTSLAAVNRRVGRLQQTAEIIRSRLHSAKEQRDAQAWVVEADASYQLVERRREKGQALSNRVDVLVKLLEAMDRAAERQVTAATRYAAAVEVGMMGANAGKLADRVRLLAGLLGKVASAKKLVSRGSPKLAALEAAYETASTAQRRQASLSALRDKIGIQSARLRRLTDARVQIDRIIAEVDIVVCETCGQPLPIGD